MAEQKFKYYFNGEGFKNKRTLAKAIVSSFLTDFGKQELEGLIEDGIDAITSSQDLTREEALKRIFVGFGSYNVKTPNPDLNDVFSATEGDNYVYMEAYCFVAGGAIISLAKRKVTDKIALSSKEIVSSLPAEVDEKDINPSAPDYKEAPQYVPQKGINEDFRIRD